MRKISVIVPVYKAEKYIEACVKSILEQTYRDYEIILVEDGSPDSSGAICDALIKMDERIRVIHKANGGAATARNAGLSAAQGEYISFIDADDYIHPQYLEYLLTMLESSGADIAMCHYNFFVDLGCCNTEMLNIAQMKNDYRVYSCKQILTEFTKHYRRVSLISLCMKLFRREIFASLCIPEGQTAEDSLVLPMLLERASTIAKSEKKLYYWRDVPNSVTRSGLSETSFHRINISDFYARFFMERKDNKIAAYFKREFLVRTLSYYYKVYREKPELLPVFAPYIRKYRRRFVNYWLTGDLCNYDRIVQLLFLLNPKFAESIFVKMYGAGIL